MTKFIFVRHGESESNKSGILSTPYTELTALGIEQAQKTGQELKAKNIKVVACSAFIRARQTAEIIALELGINVAGVKVIDTIHERRMGKVEGQPRQHESIWYFNAEDPDFEPRADILKRAHETLNTIKKLSEEGLVMVVGHGLSGFYLLQASKGVVDIKDLPEPNLLVNAGYIEVEIK
jgi:broad specificity phosphatase PhoE